jgi:ABC-type uncharacterized transport system permease subunit
VNDIVLLCCGFCRDSGLEFIFMYVLFSLWDLMSLRIQSPHFPSPPIPDNLVRAIPFAMTQEMR